MQLTSKHVFDDYCSPGMALSISNSLSVRLLPQKISPPLVSRKCSLQSVLAVLQGHLLQHWTIWQRVTLQRRGKTYRSSSDQRYTIPFHNSKYHLHFVLIFQILVQMSPCRLLSVPSTGCWQKAISSTLRTSVELS